MNNIIIAINSEKIYEEIKKEKNINVISNNIKYKEGILEILEKNKNIQYIILEEKIYGKIELEELLIKINKKNNKIKIILITQKINIYNKKITNKIEYINYKKISKEDIIQIIEKNEKVKKNNKIICICGSRGVGKTITTLMIADKISKKNKTLIIDDDIENKSIQNIYKKNIARFLINQNLEILNINKLLTNKKRESKKIINEINLLKNNYKYIFIDLKNIYNYKIYYKIIDENILLINSNILDLNKIKNINFKNTKIILNNFNKNSISEKIIKKIFNNKYKIIGKLKYNKNYNLIINEKMNFNFLDKQTNNEVNKIIFNL